MEVDRTYYKGKGKMVQDGNVLIHPQKKQKKR